MILFGDCNDTYNYSLFKFISKHSQKKVKIILFPKGNKNLDIKKIIKLFNYKLIYFKEDFPHRNKLIISYIKRERIKYGLSISFPKRLRISFLKLFNPGIFNIHPGLIQYNRGRHSAFWSIYNDSNFGCTLHIMNEKFDDGHIFDQIIYKNNGSYNSYEIHQKSNLARLLILKKNFQKILNNSFSSKSFSNTRGKYYSKKDIFKKIILKKTSNINVSELFKIIRGTSFDNHGFYINNGKKKYKIVSKIIKE
jgi:methionyl-tRNA formyltransferase